MQKQYKSVKECVRETKRKIMECQYGSFAETIIRDQLVFGASNETIRRRLLSERDITWTKALEIVISIEQAEKDAITLTSKLNHTERTQQIRFKKGQGPRSLQQDEKLAENKQKLC